MSLTNPEGVERLDTGNSDEGEEEENETELETVNEENGDELGAMYGTDGGARPRTGSLLPTFEYEDDNLEENIRDQLADKWEPTGVYEDYCPKNKNPTISNLARLMWDTKVGMRKDMLLLQDGMARWQDKAADRIKNVETNQKIMCGVIKDMETSQTDCAEQNTRTVEDQDKMLVEHNKMVQAVNCLQNEIGRLKMESNIHQRNFNEFNLRIFNLQGPITAAMATRSSRENTLDLVSELITTQRLLPNHDKEQVKEKIKAAFRVGAVKEDQVRCTLVKFVCQRSRDIIFHNAIDKQKTARMKAKTEASRDALKKQPFITEDMTQLDLREREQLKPLVDSYRSKDKPAYYTKGKIVVSKEGRISKEIVNEFLTKAQLRPVHMPPETELNIVDRSDRSRHYSAPGGSIQGNTMGYRALGYELEGVYNRFAPLFSEYAPYYPSNNPGKNRGKNKPRGRGRNNGRGRPRRP